MPIPRPRLWTTRDPVVPSRWEFVGTLAFLLLSATPYLLLNRLWDWMQESEAQATAHSGG